MSSYKKKQHNVTVFFRYLIFVGLLLVMLIVVLSSSLFYIEKINVSGIGKFTDNSIIEKINIKTGKNIFAFNYREAKKILESEPYISKAEIKMSLPDTVNINITELKPKGYVSFNGTALYIDESGTVLESVSNPDSKYPEVKGLNFDGFVLGETLDVKNKESFNVVVTMYHMITKYELLENIMTVDVSQPSDIRLYYNGIDIRLGTLDQCDEKIRTIIEILKHFTEDDKGTLDIRDMSKPPVFTHMT